MSLLYFTGFSVSAFGLLPDYSSIKVEDGGNTISGVDNVGDVDGDGKEDFAELEPGYNSSTGRVRIVSGATRSVIGTLNGDNTNDSFGRSAASIGDQNGDGRSEFVVSAPNQFSTCPGGTLGGPSGDYTGYVRAFSYNGSTFSTSYTKTGVVNGWYGEKVVGLGDEDGDAKRDFLVVGVWNNRVSSCGDIVSSQAIIYSGYNGSAIRTHSIPTACADAGSVGDIDNDGTGDYAVSSTNHTTYLYKGGNGNGTALSPNISFESVGLGNSIVGLGDVNGDGYGDFAIGRAQYGGDTSGTVKFYSGQDHSEITPALSGERSGQYFGRSLTNMGDLDGDSKNDLGVVQGHSTGSEILLIKMFSGSNHQRLGTLFDGCPIGGLHAFSMADMRPLGDLDGDSKADFVVGGTDTGILYLLSSIGINGSRCGTYRNIGPTIVVF